MLFIEIGVDDKILLPRKIILSKIFDGPRTRLHCCLNIQKMRSFYTFLCFHIKVLLRQSKSQITTLGSLNSNMLNLHHTLSCAASRGVALNRDVACHKVFSRKSKTKILQNILLQVNSGRKYIVHSVNPVKLGTQSAAGKLSKKGLKINFDFTFTGKIFIGSRACVWCCFSTGSTARGMMGIKRV